MKRYATIFDTETNGMIRNWNLKLTKENLKNSPAITLGNFPRVTQFAWQRVDLDTKEVVSEYQSLVKPDGWTIPTPDELEEQGSKDPQFFVRNNMSTERCEAEGKPAQEILDLLLVDFNQSQIMVAHNIAFDVPVVQSEMIRYKKKIAEGVSLIQICTMKETIDFCKLPSQFKNATSYKWPKLEELHRILFKEDFDGAHDAMNDVSATRKCFLRLIELSIIQTGL